MGKQSGYTRSITPESKYASQSYAHFRQDYAKRDVVNSWYDPSGGYWIEQAGHKHHDEEIEAANYLASDGYRVIMQPEDSRGVSLRVSTKNDPLYPEGKVSRAWYEQYTPNSKKANQSDDVVQALTHAHRKGASVAVLYDKYGLLHRDDIDRGIRRYKGMKFRTQRSRLALITINNKGEIHEWFTDD